MKRDQIRQAALSAIQICGTYLDNPKSEEEKTRLDLAASNIAALFELPSEEPIRIRSLVLQAAVLARIVATRLRERTGRQAVNIVFIKRATVTFQDALSELVQEIDSLPAGPAVNG